MTRKLDSVDKHILRLIAKDRDSNTGWARVSKAVYLIVLKLPPELVILEPLDSSGLGRVKLTPLGQSLVDAMEWL